MTPEQLLDTFLRALERGPMGPAAVLVEADEYAPITLRPNHTVPVGPTDGTKTRNGVRRRGH